MFSSVYLQYFRNLNRCHFEAALASMLLVKRGEVSFACYTARDQVIVNQAAYSKHGRSIGRRFTSRSDLLANARGLRTVYPWATCCSEFVGR